MFTLKSTSDFSTSFPLYIHTHTVLHRIIVIQLRAPLGKMILHINQNFEWNLIMTVQPF